MSNRVLVLAASIVASVAGGCGLQMTGSAWSAAGYRQNVFGYEVRYRDASVKAMASADWQLDNYYLDPGADSWTEKTGKDYMATRQLDWDQDGEISPYFETSQEQIFDLRIRSKKNNGVIWIKAHPLLPEQAEKELDVILDNYVDALSGHALYAQGNMFGVDKDHVRSFTTFPSAHEIIKVGAGDALAATIEIGEVDRLKQDPQSRREMIRIVMMKIRCFTPANCRLGAGTDGGGTPETSTGASGVADLPRWPEVDCRGRPCHARTALLVIGYYNTPPYFASGLPEFNDLLTRVSFPDALPLPVAAMAAGSAAPAPKVPAASAAPAPKAPAASATPAWRPATPPKAPAEPPPQ